MDQDQIRMAKQVQDWLDTKEIPANCLLQGVAKVAPRYIASSIQKLMLQSVTVKDLRLAIHKIYQEIKHA